MEKREKSGELCGAPAQAAQENTRRNGIKAKIWKWLPIIFGCHTRADRSFYYKGEKFPICARCTGELVGIIAGAALFWIVSPPIRACIVLMIPLVFDGFRQSLTSYESTNARRFVTGLLFGYALVSIFFITTKMAFLFGRSLGIKK